MWMIDRSSHLVHTLLFACFIYSFVLNLVTMILLIKFYPWSMLAQIVIPISIYHLDVAAVPLYRL